MGEINIHRVSSQEKYTLREYCILLLVLSAYFIEQGQTAD